MSRADRPGRDGATLVEVLVAVVLVGVAMMLWSAVLTGTLRRLDEAHLGLQAAVLLTEAVRGEGRSTVEGDLGADRPVGPGLMTVRAHQDGIEVRYEPPDAHPQGPGGTIYRQRRSWTLNP